MNTISTVRTEEVYVCGGNILAITTADNKCYFSPSHVCTALGISWGAQYVKIQNDPVLSGSISEIEMEVKRADTGNLTYRKVTVMPIEFLSGWLFTIKKVSPKVQAKLNRYRAEGFLALDAWFRQGLGTNPVVQSHFDIPQTLAEALKLAAQKVRENERLKAENAMMAPKADLFDAYMSTEGTLTLTEAGKILGVSGKTLGRELRYEFGWLFKRKRGIIPTQHAMKRGWMIAVPIEGAAEAGCPNCYGRITKKGLAILMDTFMIEAA